MNSESPVPSTSVPLVGKLEASAATILLNATTSARPTTLGKRTTMKGSASTSNSSSTARRQRWKLKYKDFLPESSASWDGSSEPFQLWLVPQTTNRQQFICFTDFTPSSEQDNIQTLVTRINDRIDRNELKGHVITVETTSTPIVNSYVDSEVTRWTESTADDCLYAFTLRVYYNKEANGRIYGSEKNHIGLKDFVPLQLTDGYEGFEDLNVRFNLWLKEHNDILVTNVQSVIVQKNTECHLDTGAACYYSQPGANRTAPVDLFRILRAAFIKPIGPLLVNLPIIYPITYETFNPQQRIKSKDPTVASRERIDKMKDTFEKVAAFLQNSGSEIFCAETVINPVQFYHNDLQTTPLLDEIKFILTIRLYLTSAKQSHGSSRFHKPPSVNSNGQDHTRPKVQHSVPSRSHFHKQSSITSGPAGGSRESNSENDHPGPIFLRHIVTRRYKYRWVVSCAHLLALRRRGPRDCTASGFGRVHRWVVLAATAITCMSIVVIVSIVYSNIQ